MTELSPWQTNEAREEGYFPKAIILRNVRIVDEDDGCWIWRGATNADGYGRLKFRSRQWMAHRASYVAFKGSIPKGLLVCHRCDNPICCNPEHLWLGTFVDNSLDAKNKNRHAVGERHGITKLSQEQVDRIRELVGRGGSTGVLAEWFTVSDATISNIKHGRQRAKKI